MSIESAAAFYDRLQSDVSLQEKLKTTGDRGVMEAVVGGNVNVGVVVGGLVGIVGLTGIGVAAGAFGGFTIFGIVAAGVAAA